MSDLISPAQLRAVIYWLRWKCGKEINRESNLERKEKRKEFIQAEEGNEGIGNRLQCPENYHSPVSKGTEFKQLEGPLA